MAVAGRFITTWWKKKGAGRPEVPAAAPSDSAEGGSDAGGGLQPAATSLRNCRPSCGARGQRERGVL